MEVGLKSHIHLRSGSHGKIDRTLPVLVAADDVEYRQLVLGDMGFIFSDLPYNRVDQRVARRHILAEGFYGSAVEVKPESVGREIVVHPSVSDFFRFAVVHGGFKRLVNIHVSARRIEV